MCLIYQLMDLTNLLKDSEDHKAKLNYISCTDLEMSLC